MASFQDSFEEDPLPDDLDFDNDDFDLGDTDISIFAEIFSQHNNPPSNTSSATAHSKNNLSKLLGDLVLENPLITVPSQSSDNNEPPSPPASNRTTPTKPVGKDDRREKNREAARNSRQKKKQYMNVLEDQIKLLYQQVLSLRDTHLRTTNTESRSTIIALMGKGAFRDALEQFGPASASRKYIAEYRFENLSRNCVPAHLRILSWTISQRINESQDWDRFINRLNLSEEHKMRFMQMIQTKAALGDDVTQERLRVEQTSLRLDAMRRRYLECASNISRHHFRISHVFTPNQAAAYFAWIEKRREQLGSIGWGGDL